MYIALVYIHTSTHFNMTTLTNHLISFPDYAFPIRGNLTLLIAV